MIFFKNILDEALESYDIESCLSDTYIIMTLIQTIFQPHGCNIMIYPEIPLSNVTCIDNYK